MQGSPDTGAAGPAALGLDPRLDRAGFNVAGVLSVADYDTRVASAWRSEAWLPEAHSAVVLGTGGRAFFRSFRDSPEGAPAPDGPDASDPLDRYTARIVGEAVSFERDAGWPAACGLYWERREGAFADFPGLARAAGLGAPSRLSLLLHPRFGPWWAVRAVLLTARSLEPGLPAAPDFDPCPGCPAPCQRACPGEAVQSSGFDLRACLATSARVDACRTGCDARRACVIGPTHRYDADAEAFHRGSALAAAVSLNRDRE